MASAAQSEAAPLTDQATPLTGLTAAMLTLTGVTAEEREAARLLHQFICHLPDRSLRSSSITSFYEAHPAQRRLIVGNLRRFCEKKFHTLFEWRTDVEPSGIIHAKPLLAHPPAVMRLLRAATPAAPAPTAQSPPAATEAAADADAALSPPTLAEAATASRSNQAPLIRLAAAWRAITVTAEEREAARLLHQFICELPDRSLRSSSITSFYEAHPAQRSAIIGNLRRFCEKKFHAFFEWRTDVEPTGIIHVKPLLANSPAVPAVHPLRATIPEATTSSALQASTQAAELAPAASTVWSEVVSLPPQLPSQQPSTKQVNVRLFEEVLSNGAFGLWLLNGINNKSVPLACRIIRPGKWGTGLKAALNSIVTLLEGTSIPHVVPLLENCIVTTTGDLICSYRRDIAFFNGRSTMAFELTLHDTLAQIRNVPDWKQHDLLLQLVHNAASGLAALHSYNIVHGRIGLPQSVVVSRTGVSSYCARIIDYGGIPLDDGFTDLQQNAFAVAPELRGQPPSTVLTDECRRGDAYSLARLAYFVLSAGRWEATPRDDTQEAFPELAALDKLMPGARDLLTAWHADRQPVAASMESQFLLLLVAEPDKLLDDACGLTVANATLTRSCKTLEGLLKRGPNAQWQTLISEGIALRDELADGFNQLLPKMEGNDFQDWLACIDKRLAGELNSVLMRVNGNGYRPADCMHMLRAMHSIVHYREQYSDSLLNDLGLGENAALFRYFQRHFPLAFYRAFVAKPRAEDWLKSYYSQCPPVFVAAEILDSQEWTLVDVPGTQVLELLLELGRPRKIFCVMYGGPPPEYRWLYNNDADVTGLSQLVPKTKYDNLPSALWLSAAAPGRYRCIGSNSHGDSLPFDVVVRCAEDRVEMMCSLLAGGRVMVPFAASANGFLLEVPGCSSVAEAERLCKRPLKVMVSEYRFNRQKARDDLERAMEISFPAPSVSLLQQGFGIVYRRGVDDATPAAVFVQSLPTMAPAVVSDESPGDKLAIWKDGRFGECHVVTRDAMGRFLFMRRVQGASWRPRDQEIYNIHRDATWQHVVRLLLPCEISFNSLLIPLDADAFGFTLLEALETADKDFRITLLTDVFRGLGELHGAGITHGRLLGPECVVVAQAGTRRIARLTDWHVPVDDGYPPSALRFPTAPELGPGQTSKEGDLYGLGCLAYFILSAGRFPADDAGLFLKNEVTALDAIVPGTQLLIEQLVKPDPAARWPVSRCLSDQFLLRLTDHSDALLSKITSLMELQELELVVNAMLEDGFGQLPEAQSHIHEAKAMRSLLQGLALPAGMLDWKAALPPDFVNMLEEKDAAYDGSSVFALLRGMSKVFHQSDQHFSRQVLRIHDLLDDAEDTIQPAAFFRFYFSRFPQLLFKFFQLSTLEPIARSFVSGLNLRLRDCQGLGQVEEFLARLEAARIPLDEESFNFVINAYNEGGNTRKIAQYMVKMSAAGFGTSKAKELPKVQQLDARIRALKRLEDGAEVDFNSAVCISVGPGRVGKTTTRESLQGNDFEPDQKSTRGCERLSMSVSECLSLTLKGDRFRQTSSSQLHRSVVNLANPPSKAPRASAKSQVITQASAASDSKQPSQLEASAETTAFHGEASPFTQPGETGSFVPRSAPAPAPAQDTPPITTPLSSNDIGLDDAVHSPDEDSGLHVYLLDCGGQAVFHSLVPCLMREHAIVTVFSDLKALASELEQGKGDPTPCWDELLIWLDAAVSCTKSGPVMLAFTRADQVPDEAERQRVSDELFQCLATKGHPALKRREPEGEEGLIFFPIDNTKSDNDRGLRAYREQLRICIEASPTVRRPATLPMLAFLHLLDHLSKGRSDATTPDVPAVANLRGIASCGDDGRVLHASVQQLLPLFHYCMGQDATSTDLETVLEFFDQVGVIMYSPADRDLVILDPMWLIDCLCHIVRNPGLHKLKADPIKRLERDLRDQLFNEGFLTSKCLDTLWRGMSQQLRPHILHLAERLRLFVPLQRGEQHGWIVPALLPTELPLSTQDAAKPMPGKRTSVYLAFCANMWSNSAEPLATIRDRSHLPAGLFEHLLSRLVSLVQSGGGSPPWPELSKSHARLRSDEDVIELHVDCETNCVLVTFHAHRATDRLYLVELAARQAISSLFVNMKFQTLVRLPTSSNMLCSWDFLQIKLRDQGDSFAIMGNICSRPEMCAAFSALLPPPIDNPVDVYVSLYTDTSREEAALLALALRTKLLSHAMTGPSEHLAKDGHLFTREKGILMLVTRESLVRVCEEVKAESPCLLLVEWLVALTLAESAKCVVLPLFCGSVKEVDGVASLKMFDLSAMNLPDVEHKPTFVRAKSLLAAIGLEPHRLTLRQVVESLMAFGLHLPDCILDLGVSSNAQFTWSEQMQRLFNKSVDVLKMKHEEFSTPSAEPATVSAPMASQSPNSEAESISFHEDSSVVVFKEKFAEGRFGDWHLRARLQTGLLHPVLVRCVRGDAWRDEDKLHLDFHGPQTKLNVVRLVLPCIRLPGQDCLLLILDASAFEFTLLETLKTADINLRVALLTDVFRGLGELHKANIVHGRLLGPQCVVVSGSGPRRIARLTDWGVPFNDGFLPSSSWRLPMAPELSPGAKSEKGDLFSLGRLSYIILSGGERPSDDNDRLLTVEVSALDRTFPGAELLIEKLVQADPSSRMTVAECMRSQYLLLLASSPEVLLENACGLSEATAKLRSCLETLHKASSRPGASSDLFNQVSEGRRLLGPCQNDLRSRLPHPDDWCSDLDPAVMEELNANNHRENGAHYRPKDCLHMVRAMRNIRNHREQFSSAVRSRFGLDTNAGLYRYFQNRFPRVFLQCHVLEPQVSAWLSWFYERFPPVHIAAQRMVHRSVNEATGADQSLVETWEDVTEVHAFTVPVGRPIKLRCVFYGGPAPTYHWCHVAASGHHVDLGAGDMVPKTDFEIEPSAMWFSGTLPGRYRCVGRNIHGDSQPYEFLIERAEDKVIMNCSLLPSSERPKTVAFDAARGGFWLPVSPAEDPAAAASLPHTLTVFDYAFDRARHVDDPAVKAFPSPRRFFVRPEDLQRGVAILFTRDPVPRASLVDAASGAPLIPELAQSPNTTPPPSPPHASASDDEPALISGFFDDDDNVV